MILEGHGGEGIVIRYLAFVRSTKPTMHFICLFRSCLMSTYCTLGMRQRTNSTGPLVPMGCMCWFMG